MKFNRVWNPMSDLTVPMTLGRSAPAVADQPPSATRSLTDDFKSGLEAPICLTWELTYACNLACRHCLSSSGRRNPAELSTEECFGVVDELQRLGVFYVNLGGGEPMLRRDFFDIVSGHPHMRKTGFLDAAIRATPASKSTNSIPASWSLKFLLPSSLTCR